MEEFLGFRDDCSFDARLEGRDAAGEASQRSAAASSTAAFLALEGRPQRARKISRRGPGQLEVEFTEVLTAGIHN